MKLENKTLFLLISALFLSVLVGFLWNQRRPQNKVFPPSGNPSVVDNCKADTDCVVKNVGNCCGYYPKCVNKDYEPNPKAVQERCEEMGVFSVCGYPEIEACECRKGQCVDI